MNFNQKIKDVQKKFDSLLCVGLDSEYEKIPSVVRQGKSPKEAILFFNKEIIKTTAGHVCSYKLNSAFYEALGASGIEALRETIEFIRNDHIGIPVILDAKRADIGNTNKGYVSFVFDYLKADALTVHPYLGREALEPFLEKKDKGIFVLCRTSNKGAGELQDIVSEKRKVFEILAEKIADKWNYNGNVGLVVGATYPTELNIVRQIVGDLPILIPGIGAQGGDVGDAVRNGSNAEGLGALINSSRGIIFASENEDFAQAAGKEAGRLKREINKFRKEKKI